MKVLFLGDIVGEPGRKMVKQQMRGLLQAHTPDLVIANGENAAGGFGLTPEIAEELFALGVHVLTSGNHIWDKKDIEPYLGKQERLIRPANYPSFMSENQVIPVPPEWARRAYVDDVGYRAKHAAALADPEAFWGLEGWRLDWIKPYTKVKDTSFNEADFRIRWFYDGVLNASANCTDRHLVKAGRPSGDHLGRRRSRPIQAHHLSRTPRRGLPLPNVLKAQGVKKGDRVTIYLPMIPAAAYAMLACARIGAIHSVVFGGFSPESLANRINDCDSKGSTRCPACWRRSAGAS